MRPLIPLILLAGPAYPQATSGWGNVGQQEEKGFSWKDPLWPDFWMAWTPATLSVFVMIFSAVAVIGILESFRFRDGIERRGILGLTTTLGDRLFITLLGSVYIFLGWLGLFGQPIWIPAFVAIAWGVFVFWKI